jgi:streptomycin 6-kinase
MFTDYLQRWDLVPDGEPIVTPTSRLLPVRMGGTPAMLKVAILDEERRGNQLMVSWNGVGAARVLTHDDHAIVMERAEDGVSLVDTARNGGDDEASSVLCSVLAKLHAPREQPALALPSLSEWFAPLARAADVHGGILRVAAATASRLLADPRDAVVLHGDMHHANVLRFGARGWLAIDPKGIIGERGFDYANIFCNPDNEIATKPGRLRRQSMLIAELAHLDPARLMAWVLAWAGLSAAFGIEDGLSPGYRPDIAELAAAELSC